MSGNQRIEQEMMIISEYESRILNQHVSDDDIQKYIEQQSNFKVQSLVEAEEKFKQFLQMLKTMKSQTDQAKKEAASEADTRKLVESQRDLYFDKVVKYHESYQILLNHWIYSIDVLKLAEQPVLIELK